MVLATSCLNLLESLQVPTEITWVGRGPVLDLVAASWPTVKTIEVKRGETVGPQSKVVTDLKDVHLFIDLQCNLRSHWLSRVLRKQYDIPTFSAGKAHVMRNRLILEARMRGRRKPLPESALAVQQYQFDMMCDALRQGLRHQLPVEMCDGLDTVFPPYLPLRGTTNDQPWHKELSFGAWLAVAPGAAHPTKKAEPEAFVEILTRVRDEMERRGDRAPLGIVFLGDEKDRKVVLKMQEDLVWRDSVLNLAGKLTLVEAASALKQCTALLSNDSSLAHIAEAVDTPVGVMFGPTIESFGFAPRLPTSRSFSALLGCRPCSKHGKVECRFDDKLCFAMMPTDEITQHLLDLVSSKAAKHRSKPDPRATESTRENHL